MFTKGLYVLLGIGLLIVGYIVGGYLWYWLHTLYLANDGVVDGYVDLGNAITVIVEIKHYSDGRLVEEYKKVGDPLTRNFIAIVYNTFFAQYYRGSPLPVKTTDGVVWDDFILDTAYNSKIQGAYIAVGNGTGSPSFEDYKLFNQIAIKKVDYIDSKVNVTHYLAEVKATITADRNMTVSEVGLLLKYNYKYVLLAHDIVDPPMNVEQADIIVVTYKFVFTKPFVYNFATMIAGLVLGGRTTVNIRDIYGTWRTPDFGIDYYGDDRIHEDIKLWVGRTSNPSFSMYKFGTGGEVAESETTPVVRLGYNDTCAWITVRSGIATPPDITITEAGLILETDGCPYNYCYTANQFLILYSPLDVYVTSTEGVKVKFILYYCYGE